MSHPMSSPASLLVVDDEPIIRANLAEFLQQEGFAVQTASSGEFALQLVARHKFDVILCDVNLPGLDGIEVLERVRRTRPLLPVIMLTAKGEVADRVEGLDSLLDKLRGVGVEVITKPEWDDPSVGRFARVHDPEGNPIELWEPPAG